MTKNAFWVRGFEGLIAVGQDEGLSSFSLQFTRRDDQMLTWPERAETSGAETYTLHNGLTLVVAPSAVEGTAAIAIHVAVGFRSEPSPHAGLAHLLEHLMFQDSRTGGPGEHMARIEGMGGSAGARTRHDYTEFFDVVPRSALGAAIDLELDRFTSPVFSRAGIRTQVAVIEAEIAEEVRGKPYGGFPWTSLPSAMFATWANTHDGYGDTQHLATVTQDNVQEFFHNAYGPDNIVVTVAANNITPAELEKLTLGFGLLRPRRGSTSIVTIEPDLRADHHAIAIHPNCPFPLTAVGIRLPDPVTQPAEYRGCTALPALLRLEGGASAPEARCGWFGRPLDTSLPDAWVVTAAATTESFGESLSAGVRGTLRRWTEQPYTPDFLGKLSSRLQLNHYQLTQDASFRARRLGATTSLFKDLTLLQRAAPESGVTESELRLASGFLLAQPVASLTVRAA